MSSNNSFMSFDLHRRYSHKSHDYYILLKGLQIQYFRSRFLGKVMSSKNYFMSFDLHRRHHKYRYKFHHENNLLLCLQFKMIEPFFDLK